MESKSGLTPDYIFEASWEVCNKVGGIYAVLSTKAKSIKAVLGDNLIFIGPDIWTESNNPWFEVEEGLFEEWKTHLFEQSGVTVRVGRWLIPGRPLVFLIDFDHFLERKNDIYSQMWDDYGVDSLNAYGDYDPSCMFAYSSGVVIESFYRYFGLEVNNVIAHFNEWMLGMGALYLKKKTPKIATIFTTHATCIGRSIAGNNIPLYDYLPGYNGDQMSHELNMVAKHSIEKSVAHQVDCFTTVSEITALECKQLLEREPMITPNGFEKDFIPDDGLYIAMREKARETLINVTEQLVGCEISKDAILVGTSGRYEYKNKGLDVFIDSINHLRLHSGVKKEIVAFIMVPAWISGVREDLVLRMQSMVRKHNNPLSMPFSTHHLNESWTDPVLNKIRECGFSNSSDDKVKIIFVPSYLNGDDGIFNIPYYDLLIGLDLSVFPSYYEPWGYTPHESIAFSIPTITTSLSGFGLWVMHGGDYNGIDGGVEVVYRNDSNYGDVVRSISETIARISSMKDDEIEEIHRAARNQSDKGDWEHFMKYYFDAYHEAIYSSCIRIS